MAARLSDRERPAGAIGGGGVSTLSHEGHVTPEPDLTILVPAGPGDRAWLELWPLLPMQGALERVLVLAIGDTVTAPSGVRVIHAPAGRARQLNAGLRAARGAAIWILHADSRPTPLAIVSALAFARARTVALGWFALGFHDGPPQMRLNALGANVRSRIFGMPFGDQGLIAPRRVYLDLGGFDEAVGRGEDHAFVWSARRAGVPLRRLPGRVSTSARRYVEHGWWRTTAEHLALTWRQRRIYSRGPAP